MVDRRRGSCSRVRFYKFTSMIKEVRAVSFIWRDRKRGRDRRDSINISILIFSP